MPVERTRRDGGPAASPPQGPIRKAASRAGGFLSIHPRHVEALAALGADSPEAAFDLPGEVVSGHPDRHVVRVAWLAADGAPRAAYLKRQHVVRRKERLRNALAGFGWASKSVREATTLAQLEAAGLPAPERMAHGETADGRAFLLVAEVPGAVGLREFLADPRVGTADRRLCAERIGRAFAEWHAAGFSHPEATAKHVLVDPGTLCVTVIDWAGARRTRRVSEADRLRSLAALHASLPEGPATGPDRARVLWAYRRLRRACERTARLAPFAASVAAIARVASAVGQRRSIRDQRQALVPGAALDRRLVWLAGEAACVAPDAVAVWPSPADGPPFYDSSRSADRRATDRVRFADGREGALVRGRSFAPLARLRAAVRGKSWRSPEATLARALFHLPRYGVPVPRLLAFGQRATSRCRAESFLVYEAPAGSVPFDLWYRDRAVRGRRRARAAEAMGLLLRQVHDAGCRIDGPFADEPAFYATPADPLSPVAFGAVRAVRFSKRVGDRARARDLARLRDGPLAFLRRRDRLALLRGYLGGRSADESCGLRRRLAYPFLPTARAGAEGGRP